MVKVLRSTDKGYETMCPYCKVVRSYFPKTEDRIPKRSHIKCPGCLRTYRAKSNLVYEEE